jgi:hypothetical protein
MMKLLALIALSFVTVILIAALDSRVARQKMRV